MTAAVRTVKWRRTRTGDRQVVVAMPYTGSVEHVETNACHVHVHVHTCDPPWENLAFDEKTYFCGNHKKEEW